MREKKCAGSGPAPRNDLHFCWGVGSAPAISNAMSAHLPKKWMVVTTDADTAPDQDRIEQGPSCRSRAPLRCPARCGRSPVERAKWVALLPGCFPLAGPLPGLTQ